VKTYLIRELGDNSGALVGTAVVENIADLWQTVDELANPHAYEYLRVKCSVVAMLGEGSLDFNEEAHYEMPFTDYELEDIGEPDGPASNLGPWKSMVQLCGGKAKFDTLYRQIYGLPQLASGGAS
jgi:hypothetical protein